MLKPAFEMSRAEYVARSPEWALKHEFINGQVFAMGGGTLRHGVIINNVGAALRALLRGRPCRPASSETRVYVPATGASLYPDASVICGRFETDPDDPHAVTNPVAVVEVLSPSTADYDRGAKFEHYRRLASLRHYVLVDQDTPHVTVLERVDEGWLRRDLGEGDVVSLHAVGVALPVAEIYADLDDVPAAP